MFKNKCCCLFIWEVEPKKELISFKLAHSSIWEFWMKCFKHYDAKKKFWVFLFQATGLDCLQSHHSGLSMYDKEKFHRQRNSDKNWLFICTVAAEIWKIEWFQSFWWFPRSNPCPWFGNYQFSISFFAFLWNKLFSLSYFQCFLLFQLIFPDLASDQDVSMFPNDLLFIFHSLS